MAPIEINVQNPSYCRCLLSKSQDSYSQKTSCFKSFDNLERCCYITVQRVSPFLAHPLTLTVVSRSFPFSFSFFNCDNLILCKRFNNVLHISVKQMSPVSSLSCPSWSSSKERRLPLSFWSKFRLNLNCNLCFNFCSRYFLNNAFNFSADRIIFTGRDFSCV